MALAEGNTLKLCPKRFPRDVREEINEVVHRGSWQALTEEFSVDSYTGVQPEGLDFIPNLVDSSYGEFREDVRARVESLKKTKTGNTESFKGKSKVGSNNYFYRYI